MSAGAGTEIVWREEAKTDSSSIVRAGIWSIGGVMGLFLIWALFFPLASAVITPGVFVSKGNNKLIQHDKGGKIRAIFVSEGDLLTKGQPIIELDRAEMKAELTYLKAQAFEKLGENATANTLYEYLSEQHGDSQYGYFAKEKLLTKHES